MKGESEPLIIEGAAGPLIDRRGRAKGLSIVSERFASRPRGAITITVEFTCTCTCTATGSITSAITITITIPITSTAY